MSLDPTEAIVAAVQYAPQPLKVEENLATAQQMAFEAASKGARIIVLPELCISGYTLSTPSHAMSCAQTKDGFQTEAFVPIARRFGCHIVFGYVQLFEGKLYNSAAVVGPNGLEASFQKHNREGNDHFWATPSSQVPPVVVTEAGRLGVLISRDGMNKYRESYFFNHGQQFYKRGNADTIALLASQAEVQSFPDSSWVELAEDTRANVIVSNRLGVENDSTLCRGGSAVIDRNLRVWSNGSSFDSPCVVGGIVKVG